MLIQKIIIQFNNLTEEYFDGKIIKTNVIYVYDNTEYIKMCADENNQIIFYREYKSNEFLLEIENCRDNKKYNINLEDYAEYYKHEIFIKI